MNSNKCKVEPSQNQHRFQLVLKEKETQRANFIWNFGGGFFWSEVSEINEHANTVLNIYIYVKKEMDFEKGTKQIK